MPKQLGKSDKHRIFIGCQKQSNELCAKLLMGRYTLIMEKTVSYQLKETIKLGIMNSKITSY